MMQNIGPGFGLFVTILVIVLAILWIALPFAVFGIKKQLDAILVELKRLFTLDNFDNPRVCYPISRKPLLYG